MVRQDETSNLREAQMKLELMRDAFRTTVSYGRERRYEMVFSFPTLDALHAADDEWRTAIAMDTRSAETEGLGPKDDSAGPSGHRTDTVEDQPS